MIDYYGQCPSCQGHILKLLYDPTFFDSPDGTSGMFQLVKCDECGKTFDVKWQEFTPPTNIVSGKKMFNLLKCNDCGYEKKAELTAFNYVTALLYKHQQETGHANIFVTSSSEGEDTQ